MQPPQPSCGKAPTQEPFTATQIQRLPLPLILSSIVFVDTTTGLLTRLGHEAPDVARELRQDDRSLMQHLFVDQAIPSRWLDHHNTTQHTSVNLPSAAPGSDPRSGGARCTSSKPPPPSEAGLPKHAGQPALQRGLGLVQARHAASPPLRREGGWGSCCHGGRTNATPNSTPGSSHILL